MELCQPAARLIDRHVMFMSVKEGERERERDLTYQAAVKERNEQFDMSIHHSQRTFVH